MKTKSPNKEEKLFYQLLYDIRSISIPTIDEAILKFTDPRLTSLTKWLKKYKLYG